MMRDYAREKLMAAGELEPLGRRHADYYGTMSMKLREALRGPEQAAWVARLSIGSGAGEIDNSRAAMRWHTDHGEPDQVARLVWSMWLLGWISGRLEECRWWARQALDIEGPLSRGGRARLLTVAGLMEMWKGEYSTSLPALTEAVAIARELGDDDLLANSLLGLSLVSSFVEGVHVARAQAEEANGLFRARGDRWGQATSSSIRTWFLVAEDDFKSTGAIFDEALSIADELADELNHAMIETNVAEYRMHLGHHDDAGRLLASSLSRHRKLRGFYPSSYAIDAAARLAALTGRPQIATTLLGAAEGLREAIGVPVESSHRSRRYRLTERLRRDLTDAVFAQALSEGRRLDYEEAIDAAIAAVSVPASADQNPTQREPTGSRP
jgi:tetratricopeptide (TPR) repeat protein